MPLTWQTSPTDAWVPFARDYANAIRRGVREIVQQMTPAITAWMKQNALWIDRTGNARQTLNAEWEQVGLDMFEIILAHGVNYGVFLELASGGGRYAIIAPAIDVWAPRLWDAIRRMLS